MFFRKLIVRELSRGSRQWSWCTLPQGDAALLQDCAVLWLLVAELVVHVGPGISGFVVAVQVK